MVQFQQREAELSAWALPARELYVGLQHRYMMSGVDMIRRHFGASLELNCTALLMTMTNASLWPSWVNSAVNITGMTGWTSSRVARPFALLRRPGLCQLNLSSKGAAQFPVFIPQAWGRWANVILPSTLVLIKIPFSLFDLADGLINKFKRALPMSALVRCCFLYLSFRFAQVSISGAHVGLMSRLICVLGWMSDRIKAQAQQYCQCAADCGKFRTHTISSCFCFHTEAFQGYCHFPGCL
jgi:hypothetical protein